MAIVYRPLPIWPHKPTEPRRRAQFQSPSKHIEGYGYKPGARVPIERTIRELEFEVDQLQARDQQLIITVAAGYREGDIRQDGRPRSDARAPLHPGVEVSFESLHGRLAYATDVFDDWRDNLRAIAKGLEALRAVARWGVAKQGQQYAGFARITAGPSPEQLGEELVRRFGSVTAALRATHPDTGTTEASDRNFAAVIAFRDSRVSAG